MFAARMNHGDAPVAAAPNRDHKPVVTTTYVRRCGTRRVISSSASSPEGEESTLQDMEASLRRERDPDQRAQIAARLAILREAYQRSAIARRRCAPSPTAGDTGRTSDPGSSVVNRGSVDSVWWRRCVLPALGLLAILGALLLAAL